MNITLILFWIEILGLLLYRKNIISQTSKFLFSRSYKNVYLIGPAFKSINEGFLKLTVTFPLSRFMVSDFFGRKVRESFQVYSTLGKNTVKQLHPFYVTGLADGESTFYLGISKSSRCKVGWTIIPSFSIELHSKDLELLGRIKTFFTVGRIRVRSRDGQLIYSVSSIEELTNVSIPHFDKYPLATQKSKDF